MCRELLLIFQRIVYLASTGLNLFEHKSEQETLERLKSKMYPLIHFNAVSWNRIFVNCCSCGLFL